MKIRIVKSKQILLLYLLKSKIYEQVIVKNTSSLLVKSCLTELLVNLKKSLQIIFNYHIKNKLIVFVGLPKNLSSKINKSTSHISLSKYSSLQGNLSNVSKSILNKVTEKNFKKFGKKPDLIILVDHINIDAIVKESYSAKIPLICINSRYDKKFFFYHNIYKIPISSDLLQSLYNFFFCWVEFYI